MRSVTSPASVTHPVLERIGNTPLLDVSSYARESGLEGVRLFAKAEWHNPGGSVKDRPAWNMIRNALADGRLVRGKAILDATSGNTGIAYALIAHFLGYEAHIVAPENMDAGRKAVLQRYGARLITSSSLEGSDGAIRLCRELYTKNPDRYFYPDQYNNPDNPRAHYLTTGPEIYNALGGRLDAFVAAIGTSGSLMGTGRYLRDRIPSLKGYAAQPDD